MVFRSQESFPQKIDHSVDVKEHDDVAFIMSNNSEQCRHQDEAVSSFLWWRLMITDKIYSYADIFKAK